MLAHLMMLQMKISVPRFINLFFCSLLTAEKGESHSMNYLNFPFILQEDASYHSITQTFFAFSGFETFYQRVHRPIAPVRTFHFCKRKLCLLQVLMYL